MSEYCYLTVQTVNEIFMFVYILEPNNIFVVNKDEDCSDVAVACCCNAEMYPRHIKHQR